MIAHFIGQPGDRKSNQLARQGADAVGPFAAPFDRVPHDMLEIGLVLLDLRADFALRLVRELVIDLRGHDLLVGQWREREAGRRAHQRNAVTRSLFAQRFERVGLALVVLGIDCFQARTELVTLEGRWNRCAELLDPTLHVLLQLCRLTGRHGNRDRPARFDEVIHIAPIVGPRLPARGRAQQRFHGRTLADTGGSECKDVVAFVDNAYRKLQRIDCA